MKQQAHSTALTRSTPAAVSAARRPRVIVERELAAPDTDTATLQTVRRMCQYIRESVSDPMLQAAAAYAWKRFGGGVDNPAAKCWGVFWWVKHCIAFRQDEATMFRIGERDQQDLLISPAVLVRLKNPAEDCDGFTMLCAAMLAALGVPVVIATVAAERARPWRWSHVFPCALLPGDQVLPIDASHGSAPGWMVPPDDIHRWQAWGLDARPVNVRPLDHRGLHGYRRSNYGTGFGMGDVVTLATPDGGGGASTTGWGSFWQDMIRTGVDIAGRVLTPPAYQQTVRDPNTGQVYATTVRNATPSTAATAAGGSLGGTNTLLLVGGGLLGLVVLASVLKNRD